MIRNPKSPPAPADPSLALVDATLAARAQIAGLTAGRDALRRRVEELEARLGEGERKEGEI
jgi:hypothetical protein